MAHLGRGERSVVVDLDSPVVVEDVRRAIAVDDGGITIGAAHHVRIGELFANDPPDLGPEERIVGLPPGH